MSMSSVLLLIATLLLAVFIGINWQAFTAVTTLSVLVTTFQAPLGLVMVTLLAIAAVTFLAYALYLQSRYALDRRRLMREVDRERALASDAEASRIVQLRTALESRLDQLLALQQQRSSEDLRTVVEHGFNGLAAQIAELDDRMSGRATATPTR